MTKRRRTRQYNDQKKKDRQYNDQKKKNQTIQWPKEEGQTIQWPKEEEPDNTMAKRRRTKGQTMIYKTLHRKHKIEQCEPL